MATVALPTLRQAQPLFECVSDEDQPVRGQWSRDVREGNVWK